MFFKVKNNLSVLFVGFCIVMCDRETEWTDVGLWGLRLTEEFVVFMKVITFLRGIRWRYGGNCTLKRFCFKSFVPACYRLAQSYVPLFMPYTFCCPSGLPPLKDVVKIRTEPQNMKAQEYIGYVGNLQCEEGALGARPAKLQICYLLLLFGIATGYGKDGRGIEVRVPVRLRFSFSPRRPESKNLVIPSVIHHRQNPLESTRTSIKSSVAMRCWYEA
jgi:hypothetical protein